MEHNYQTIEERLAKVPPDIRAAITSTDVAEKVQNIARSHNLHIDQMDELFDETGLMMLGLTKTSEFVGNIATRLNVPREKAAEIAGNVNEKIFAPIRESLKKIHGVDGEGSAPAGAPSAAPLPPQTPRAAPAPPSPTAPAQKPAVAAVPAQPQPPPSRPEAGQPGTQSSPLATPLHPAQPIPTNQFASSPATGSPDVSYQPGFSRPAASFAPPPSAAPAARQPLSPALERELSGAPRPPVPPAQPPRAAAASGVPLPPRAPEAPARDDAAENTLNQADALRELESDMSEPPAARPPQPERAASTLPPQHLEKLQSVVPSPQETIVVKRDEPGAAENDRKRSDPYREPLL
jgi:hypothetical protein